jgi:hypothetical protein
LKEQVVRGNYRCKKDDYDKIDIVIASIDDEKLDSDQVKTDANGLLTILFGNNRTDKEIIQILKEKFSFPTDTKYAKEIREMCNISAGIEEKALAKGILIGESNGKLESSKEIALAMLEDGEPLEKIAKYTKFPIEVIQSWIKE